jgi:hypothetical protein
MNGIEHARRRQPLPRIKHAKPGGNTTQVWDERATALHEDVTSNAETLSMSVKWQLALKRLEETVNGVG